MMRPLTALQPAPLCAEITLPVNSSADLRASTQ